MEPPAGAPRGSKRATTEVAGGATKKAAVSVAVELQVGAKGPTLGDVQNLLLRLFTSEYGDNPQWILIRGMSLIRSAVVMLLPCLDAGTVGANESHAPGLARLLKGSSCTKMRCAGEIEHMPADQCAHLVGCRLLQGLLSARARPAVSSKRLPVGIPKPAAGPKPHIATYLASAEERARSGYPGAADASRPGWALLHGAAPASAGAQLQGTEDPDRALLYSMDCEMVLTASGPALARCTVVGPDGEQVYDTLVRPGEAVADYLTPYSGITAESLEGVTVTLQDVQAKLCEILPDRAILVGHSLENDLQALQLVYERVVDTAILYPHARGWPHRNSLAGLSSSMLRRKLDRKHGHDSVADAKAALELFLLKLEKGPSFGTAGGASVPLGQLLRGTGVPISLEDVEAPERAGAAAWHLGGCEVVAANGEAKDVDGKASASSSRAVRLVVLRAYEKLCEAGAAEASGSAAEVAACLARIETRLRHTAADLAADELLIVLSGCGDWHAVRRLEIPQTPVELATAARKRFNQAFGVFALGGESLRRQLEGEDKAVVLVPPPAPTVQRELICYDI